MATRKSPKPKEQALAAVATVAALAGFGRFATSRLAAYARTNAIDDAIETKANELLVLIASTLSKRRARSIARKATAEAIRQDALDCGLSPVEARRLASVRSKGRR